MTTEQTKQRAELIESLERKLSDAEQIKASSIAIRTFQVEQILTALKQKEWISVEDGLPEMKQLVLVYGILNKEVGKDDTKKSIGLVEWNVPMASDCKDTDQYSMWYTKITHWMPLPQKPTES